MGIDPTVHVTPAAPSKTDQKENASGFITIPGTTGVDYKLDTVVTAGNHDVAPGPHAVVATPQFGYVLDGGVTGWNLTVKAWVPFMMTAGAFAFQYGTPAGYSACGAPVVDTPRPALGAVGVTEQIDAARHRQRKRSARTCKDLQRSATGAQHQGDAESRV